MPNSKSLAEVPGLKLQVLLLPRVWGSARQMCHTKHVPHALVLGWVRGMVAFPCLLLVKGQGWGSGDARTVSRQVAPSPQLEQGVFEGCQLWTG